jgi:carboxypeptidase C (cathepsin A)
MLALLIGGAIAVAQEAAPLEPKEQSAPVESEQQDAPVEPKQQSAPVEPKQPVAAGNKAPNETQRPRRTAPLAAASRRIPPDSTTQHRVELPGRTLKFEATAGSIPLIGADGQVQANMAYVSHVLLGADTKARPVAFVFNGGPGSSSAWLHLGTLGPWRLPIDGLDVAPSTSIATVPNAETWLDFADLVLIDPIGTGYSRFAPERKSGETTGGGEATAPGKARSGDRKESLRKRFWSVKGDIDSIASFIAKWVNKTGRHASPKLLVGESYGGFRVPKLARTLQSDYGVGTSLLVIISPVLDYGFLRGQRHLPLNSVALLPSLAAAALEKGGKTPTAALMRDVEQYARGEYLTDLMRGPRDSAAVDRVVERVAKLTGLPTATVHRYGGRLDSFGFRQETNLSAGRVASAYDASITGYNPNPHSPYSHAEDPFVGALRAPLTGAMLDIYANKLGWRSEARYFLINGEVPSNWQYGSSASLPEAVSELKAAVALDSHLRVLVAHGYTDLVTPYFASTMVLDQLPPYGDAQRIVQINYPGGHMFYSRDASRAAFREDVLIMLAASLNGEPRTR